MDIKNLAQFLNNGNDKVLQVEYDGRLRLFVKIVDEKTQSVDVFCGTFGTRESNHTLKKCFTFFPKKNTIVFVDGLPHEMFILYGFDDKNIMELLKEQGFVCTTFKDLTKELVNKYTDYVKTSLMKKYPTFESLKEQYDQHYNEDWYNSQAKQYLMAKKEPTLIIDIPSSIQQSNEGLLIDIWANDNVQTAVEIYAERMESQNIQLLFSYYAMLKAMKDNKLTNEEKEASDKANKILNFVKINKAKSVTMVYDTAEMLAKANEIVNCDDFETKHRYGYQSSMKQILSYLKEHNEIEFKVKNEYGDIVKSSTTDFLSTYNTNLSSIFRLGRYDSFPIEIAKMFGNPKYMKDCLYRGKSIL